MEKARSQGSSGAASKGATTTCRNPSACRRCQWHTSAPPGGGAAKPLTTCEKTSLGTLQFTRGQKTKSTLRNHRCVQRDVRDFHASASLTETIVSFVQDPRSTCWLWTSNGHRHTHGSFTLDGYIFSVPTYAHVNTHRFHMFLLFSD